MKTPVTKTNAQYRDSASVDEQNNPLALAMPNRFEPNIVRNALSNIVTLPDISKLTDEQREALAEKVHKMRIPSAEHYDLYCKIYSMVHKGYLVRNPTEPEVISWSYDISDPKMSVDDTKRSQIGWDLPNTTADAIFITGPSGVGKSTINELLLFKCFPQLVEHSLNDFTDAQIMYLKVDMPHDGSRGGLLEAILVELDRVLAQSNIEHPNYIKAITKNEKGYKNIAQMERVVISALNRHHVGVLFLDEFQNLLVATYNRRKEMLQLLDTFANKLYVPTIKVGTPNSRELVSRNARHLRRLGEPFFFSPLSDDSKAWERCMKALFAFQPLHKPIGRNKKIEAQLKSLSAGIPDFLMKLWKGVLVQAIRSGKEKITQTMITQVFKRQFPLLRTVIRHIAAGKSGQYADLITAQQYFDSGNDQNAIKFLGQFAQASKLTGTAALDVIEDIERALEGHELTKTQQNKLASIKSKLLEQSKQASGPQTIEQKKS